MRSHSSWRSRRTGSCPGRAGRSPPVSGPARGPRSTGSGSSTCAHLPLPDHRLPDTLAGAALGGGGPRWRSAGRARRRSTPPGHVGHQRLGVQWPWRWTRNSPSHARIGLDLGACAAPRPCGPRSASRRSHSCAAIRQPSMAFNWGSSRRKPAAQWTSCSTPWRVVGHLDAEQPAHAVVPRGRAGRRRRASPSTSAQLELEAQHDVQRVGELVGRRRGSATGARATIDRVQRLAARRRSRAVGELVRRCTPAKAGLRADVVLPQLALGLVDRHRRAGAEGRALKTREPIWKP